MSPDSDSASDQAGKLNTQPFLVYHLEGKRFANHEVPLPFLGELQSYQKLFIELAHKLYKDANPEKKIVPRGFDAAFTFNLKGIRKGSAGLCISFQKETESQEYDEIRQKSRKLIESNVHSLLTEKKLTREFPPHLSHYLAELGKNLAEDETGSFSAPDEEPLCKIDKAGNQSIKAFVEIIDTPSALEFNTEGIAFAIDTKKTTFGVKFDDGATFECPLPARYTRLILSAIEENDKIRVGIKGKFAVTADGRKTVQEISHINLIDDSPRVFARIQTLKDLPNNWLNSDSVSPDPKGLTWLNELFEGLIKNYKIPSPFLFPTPEGNIQAEWVFGEWLMEGVFNLSSKKLELAAYHTPDKHQEEFERTIDLESPNGAFELVAMVVKFMKK